MPSQAQKHVTHNEALEQLDLLAQLHVLAFNMETPPGVVSSGDTYALGASPTGAWVGNAEKLALYQESDWVFITPNDGWLAVDSTTRILHVFQAGIWHPKVAESNNLDGIGIRSTWDATNRLSVSSPASLFNHDGSDHQLKINKAATGDTASLLFQNNWSGRAEMGLAGENDFTVKVSDDGSNWTTGLKVAADTGFVTTPQISSGHIDIAQDAVGTIPTPSAGGFVLLTMVDATFPQAQHSGILVYDTGSSLSLATLILGLSADNRGTAMLTGTTGDAGRTSFAVQSGSLQIENRRTGSRQYSYTFIGGS
jgi:hypothetical protein